MCLRRLIVGIPAVILAASLFIFILMFLSLSLSRLNIPFHCSSLSMVAEKLSSPFSTSHQTTIQSTVSQPFSGPHFGCLPNQTIFTGSVKFCLMFLLKYAHIVSVFVVVLLTGGSGFGHSYTRISDDL